MGSVVAFEDSTISVEAGVWRWAVHVGPGGRISTFPAGEGSPIAGWESSASIETVGGSTVPGAASGCSERSMDWSSSSSSVEFSLF